MEDSAYLRDCEALRTVWIERIAGTDGPLPGSDLDPLITPQGWCGHVLLAEGQRAATVIEAATDIASAYDLPDGSIVVRTMAENRQVFLWAYATKSGADYHLSWPHPVLDGSEFVDIKRESSGTTLFDLVQLTTWARAHKESWEAIRAGRDQDVQQFVRRFTRLRAGIVDILTRAKPQQVRELLLRVGLDRASLPNDLAEQIGYPKDRDPTIPIPR
ncbi:hypothetical protein LWC34_31110 [Kibdelosporangium philippinense]|uniref:Transcriptional regulator n=1 Tax=Kibdelosporangium philippinense TaxID=211113 RepID=A0ABS8ZHD8_9PSEU|nr:hypothetical protein [Kibdelosporangium philippinense]MCE7007238.1 hypothetical protein [Kibdelosporangium philippinense]